MGSIDYLRNDETIEVIVYDGTGRKIESFSCQRRNRKRYKQILDFLKDKYDFIPLIEDKIIEDTTEIIP
jgi:hypothetical protein